MSEFDETLQKIKNMKLKIEEETEKVDNSYQKIENEITLSFKKQHLELDDTEKKLKLELKVKVNQIKNELKDYLAKLKNILISCEKTYEMVEKYEKKSNNDIKTLYYISEINKNEEKAKDFFIKKIRNSDISFLSDKYIFYEDYYFNGIPIPKNIKAEKKEGKLYISWDLDDSIIKRIDFKNISYSIILKSKDLLLGHISEITNNKYYYYDNYNENYDYEIKVRTVLDGCYSDWSVIKKCKIEGQSKPNIFLNNNSQKNSLFSIKNNDNNISNNISNQSFQSGYLFGNNIYNNTNIVGGLFGDIGDKNKIFSTNDNKNNNQENSFLKLPLFDNNSSNNIFSSNFKFPRIFESNNNQKKCEGFFQINDDKGGLFFNNKNNQGGGLFGNKNDKKENNDVEKDKEEVEQDGNNNISNK